MTRVTIRNGNNIRRWLEWTLLLAGIAGVGVWAGSQLITTVWQAWAGRVFDIQTGDHEVPVQPVTIVDERVQEGSLVGRLSIPRLKLSAMVREGVGEETLSLALGHVPSTAVPGQNGNVAIAGHRDTLFRGLRGIRKNDLIRFETPSSGSHVYEVGSIEIVKPSDVSVLNPSPSSELTLITCYPFYYIGAAPERFIVKAHEVDFAALNATNIAKD
jgi:LPXTG-site transpeptidase (sortase) family protein